MNTTFKILVAGLFLLVTFTGRSKAQETLSFQYDAAGNQMLREWICINCTPEQLASINKKDLEALDKSLKDQKEDKLSSFRAIKAYPNPLTELLHLEWSSSNNISIKSIEIYSLGGVRVFREEYLPSQQSASISFVNLSIGTYIIHAFYSDGKKEILKVIKI